jgi:hypothetical protein
MAPKLVAPTACRALIVGPVCRPCGRTLLYDRRTIGAGLRGSVGFAVDRHTLRNFADPTAPPTAKLLATLRRSCQSVFTALVSLQAL